MAPPDLAGDVPVRRVLERLNRETVLRVRVETDATGTERLERRPSQLRHRAPPLQRDPRLDATVTAIAERHLVAVRLPLLELAVLLQPLEDALVRFLLRQSCELTGLLVHPAVRSDHRDLRQTVVEADLVVERVVTRRHLERAGAEVALDALVGDHRYAAPDHGNDHLAVDQAPVAIVVRVHGHRYVRQDRRRLRAGSARSSAHRPPPRVRPRGRRATSDGTGTS